MMKHLIITLVFVMTLNSPVAAQVSTKGLAALEAYDYATALEELLPLAEQGDARAQSFLGGMYALGTGVLQDYAEAVKWYRLAAEQGNVSAQVSLAFAFHSGAGVEQDYFAAVKWFTLAARQGNAIAQFQLALMYRRGTGVAQENVRSYMWFSVASTNGDIHKNKHNRDKTAAKMTAADISKAQAMARQCMSSRYRKCGY